MKKIGSLWAFSSLVLCLGLTGCGGGSGGGGNNNSNPPIKQPPPGAGTTTPPGTTTPTAPGVTTLTVSPSNPTVEVGQTIVITALGSSSTGAAVTVPTSNWSWTSSDGSVAVLVSDGFRATIYGVKAGSAVITAKEGASQISRAVTLTVTAIPVTGNPGGTTPTVAYNSNFENGVGSEWSVNKTDVTPGTSQRGSTRFLGQFGGETASLSLANLAAHTTTTVEGDLFIIRSMDGNGAVDALIGPDLWELNVEGGPVLLHTTFSNITPEIAQGNHPYGYEQAYPDNYPGGVHPYHTGASEENTLGFQFGDFNKVYDAVYHLKYTFAHSAGTVKLNFKSSNDQNLSDESWGLKNVKVTLNP
ncbi:MAG: Ig domain-containing protein [Chthonomonadaceae bacterium]|nr:Ig domain-containing protein [Chthonomonadaceae bacterium]